MVNSSSEGAKSTTAPGHIEKYFNIISSNISACGFVPVGKKIIIIFITIIVKNLAV